MSIATLINTAFTAIAAARPVSHAAAVALLGTSIYGVHEGAVAVLPAGLASATTVGMIAMEWLQWTSLGRIAKLDEASEFERSAVLKLQCFGIAGLQVLLYTVAVVNFASKGGLDWAHGWPLFGSIAIAALYAALNFIAKWTSCENVSTGRQAHNPTGGQRAHAAVFASKNDVPPRFADNVADLAERRAVVEFRREADREAPPARTKSRGQDFITVAVDRDKRGRFKRAAIA